MGRETQNAAENLVRPFEMMTKSLYGHVHVGTLPHAGTVPYRSCNGPRRYELLNADWSENYSIYYFTYFRTFRWLS
jgi:hypothetical protein